MITAALVIAVVANIGDGANLYQTETWSGPTEIDLVVCATMANDLNAQFDELVRKGLNRDWQYKTATCEITVKGL